MVVVVMVVVVVVVVMMMMMMMMMMHADHHGMTDEHKVCLPTIAYHEPLSPLRAGVRQHADEVSHGPPDGWWR